jgi:hypothetical protein
LLTGLRQGHSAKLSRSPKRQPLSYSGYLWLIRVPSEGQSARTHLADQADRRFKPCHNPVTPPQADLRAVSVCFHTNTITLYSTNNRLSIIFKKNLPAYFINSAKMLVYRRFFRRAAGHCEASTQAVAISNLVRHNVLADFTHGSILFSPRTGVYPPSVWRAGGFYRYKPVR